MIAIRTANDNFSSVGTVDAALLSGFACLGTAQLAVEEALPFQESEFIADAKVRSGTGKITAYCEIGTTSPTTMWLLGY